MSYEFPKCLLAIGPMNGRMPGGEQGDQIIKVPIEYILSLHQMHPEVQVVKSVAPPVTVLSMPAWPKDHVPYPRDMPLADHYFIYLHIRSRYAMRCYENQPMVIEDFTAFLERYHNLWKECA